MSIVVAGLAVLALLSAAGLGGRELEERALLEGMLGKAQHEDAWEYAATSPALLRLLRERERCRPAGLGGGVDVGAGAQQRERALGREELEVVERRRPEAAANEEGDDVVVAAAGGHALRRVVRRGQGEGAAGAVG